MNLFYTPNIKSDTYILDEVESKHCIKVLRMTVGDEISLVDGKGCFYTAKIIDANQKHCQVTIINKDFKENIYKNINIAIAPTKNMDRFEWFLEKATEIGVNSVFPILTSNSERKIVKPERLHKVVVAAMKQSLKATKPCIHELGNFADIAKEVAGYDCKFIAYCDSYENKELFKKLYNPSLKTIIFIGPEGDFTAKEVDFAKSLGFKVVSLGESRLRTETAGVVACTLMNV